jgi:hypothetical protein
MYSGIILTRIAVDPLFPPPPSFGTSNRTTNDILPDIKFELVFDEANK